MHSPCPLRASILDAQLLPKHVYKGLAGIQMLPTFSQCSTISYYLLLNMRPSISQISLTGVVALTVYLSASGLSAEALPTIPAHHQPHTSSSPSFLQHSSTLSPRSSIKTYDHHRVVRVNVQSEDQLKTLTENEGPLQFDYFTHQTKIGGHMDIRIAPEHFSKFQSLNLDHEILVDNLQMLVDQEREENERYQQSWAMNKMNKVSSQGETMNALADDWFAGYHRYEEHKPWLDELIQHGSSVASGFSAGKTVEGRDLDGIKIGSGPNNVVFIGKAEDTFYVLFVTPMAGE